MFAPLEIIYEDQSLVAINKPHGLLVHRSSIAADVEVFVLQLLRDQLDNDTYIYPIHRIDRKTCGVLLFAKNKELVAPMQSLFQTQEINKTYKAILRGWLIGEGHIDYPVKNDRGNAKTAQTNYKMLEHFEIDLPHGIHSTSRYSLVHLEPKTGRWHQLRQHMNHLRHPIIGDRPHGCSKQNRLWKHEFNMTKMMLWASKMTFIHPVTQNTVTIKAEASPTWNRVIKILQSKSTIHQKT